MKIAQVKKMKPFSRFIYWIRERHKIYLARSEGKSAPWTDDEILQSEFFTNPYRENDRVTVWFRENVRDPLRDEIEVVFATIAFRWFNLPSTGEILMGSANTQNLLTRWDAKKALARLDKARERKQRIFTGAYIINCQTSEPKHVCVIRRLDKVWQDRRNLHDVFVRPKVWGGKSSCSLQDAHEALVKYEGLGGFMAYEIVCDLRYTRWLENAPDIGTWCNPGPGAVRGLHRINGGSFATMGIKSNAGAPKTPPDFIEQCQKLLRKVNEQLAAKNPNMPPFEMREIEHSLCEFDKYERVLWGEGRSKRRYNGKG